MSVLNLRRTRKKKKKMKRRRMMILIRMTLNGELQAGLGCDRGYVDRVVMNMVRVTIIEGVIS